MLSRNRCSWRNKMTGPEREHMPDLPVCLEELYENFSLIRNEKAVVFKARQKSSGLPVLIKITVDEAEKEQFQNEYQLLRRIETECSRQDSSLFPRAVQFFEAVGESNQAAIVREFVSGFTVEQLVDMCKARPGLSEEKTLQIGKDVLRMLRILHTMHPPVIHRDIKPQNVVMDSNGQCHLIDFGISRCFSEDGAQDTNVMGTRLTAPPEQFGYRQTDQRSDIYSVGVLLRFCLTGEYLERADAMICKEIRQIIARATQFDPNNRYPGADKMLAAIERATDEEKRKEFLRKMGIRSATVLAVLLCFCFLIAGAQWHPAVSSSGEAYAGPGKIHFREPLIEQAVRTLLNKSETPLSKEDLALVTSLHIFGKQIYTAENQIDFLGQFVWMKDPAMNSSGLFKENGGIVSLDDLALLPNLQELYLYGQSIEDISALKDTKIARIGIGHNPLTDLSPGTIWLSVS